MAYDKAVDSAALDAGLKAIADAIREKSGTSADLEFPTAMAEAIVAIEAGGGFFAEGEFTPAENITTEYILDIGYPTQALEDWAPNGFILLIYITEEDSYTNSAGCILDGYFNCESRMQHSSIHVYHGTMNKVINYAGKITRTDDNKIKIGPANTYALASGVTFYWRVVLK